jgi:hypothetical protein
MQKCGERSPPVPIDRRAWALRPAGIGTIEYLYYPTPKRRPAATDLAIAQIDMSVNRPRVRGVVAEILLYVANASWSVAT